MEIIPVVERAITHDREFGDFIVIFRDSVKKFDSLSSAFKFYFLIDNEASLWDITGTEELLESKCVVINTSNDEIKNFRNNNSNY